MCVFGASAGTPMAPSCVCAIQALSSTLKQLIVKVKPKLSSGVLLYLIVSEVSTCQLELFDRHATFRFKHSLVGYD